METKNIEVAVGKEGKASDPSKAGKSVAAPPSGGGSVGGRAWVYKYMECWNCHRISTIEYDTDAYHTYICCYCGAENTV